MISFRGLQCQGAPVAYAHMAVSSATMAVQRIPMGWLHSSVCQAARACVRPICLIAKPDDRAGMRSCRSVRINCAIQAFVPAIATSAWAIAAWMS